jgi:hypothetical protein
MAQLPNNQNGGKQTVKMLRKWWQKKSVWIPVMIMSHFIFAICFAKIGAAHLFRPTPYDRNYTISCDSRTPNLLLKSIVNHVVDQGKYIDETLIFLVENDFIVESVSWKSQEKKLEIVMFDSEIRPCDGFISEMVFNYVPAQIVLDFDESNRLIKATDIRFNPPLSVNIQ